MGHKPESLYMFSDSTFPGPRRVSGIPNSEMCFRSSECRYWFGELPGCISGVCSGFQTFPKPNFLDAGCASLTRHLPKNLTRIWPRGCWGDSQRNFTQDCLSGLFSEDRLPKNSVLRAHFSRIWKGAYWGDSQCNFTQDCLLGLFSEDHLPGNSLPRAHPNSAIWWIQQGESN